MLAELLELLAPSVCPGCDRRRDEATPLLCSGCARLLESRPEQDGVVTALAYRGVAAELVRRFKFEGRIDALRALIGPLVWRLETVEFDAVVPIPRHTARIRALGSDPAHALSRAVARATGARLCAGALLRTRETPPQTGLRPGERRRNVAGSFRAGRPVTGSRVLLLDDVTTTGATLAEARRVLRRAQTGSAGGRPIVCAALAGAPLASDGPPAL